MYQEPHDYCETPIAKNFSENPTALFQAEMQQVAESMAELPFYRADIPCFCPKFVLFEGQWIGVVLTPWLLSVVVLPGPEQYWDTRKIGDKIALQFPNKTLLFTVSSLPNIPQYLSCSLMSPLASTLTTEQAQQLARDCLHQLLSLPVQETTDLSKRHIFQAMLK